MIKALTPDCTYGKKNSRSAILWTKTMEAMDMFQLPNILTCILTKAIWVLHMHFETVIKSRIPGLQSLINKSIAELEAEFSRFGNPVASNAGGKLYSIMEICRLYDGIYKKYLGGMYVAGRLECSCSCPHMWIHFSTGSPRKPRIRKLMRVVLQWPSMVVVCLLMTSGVLMLLLLQPLVAVQTGLLMQEFPWKEER